MSMFFVGIDVSKDYSSAQGLDREGKRLFYLEFTMNGDGFSQFLTVLKTHGEDLSGVTVGMESTLAASIRTNRTRCYCRA